MNLKQINSCFNSNDKERLNLAVQSAVFHAHVHGNISPILNACEKHQSKSLANGAKIVSYLKLHAPVVWDKKAKKPVYDAKKADRNYTEEMANSLPDLFARKEVEPKFTVSNFKRKEEKLELATNEQLTAELAAVKAYAKVLEELFMEKV